MHFRGEAEDGDALISGNETGLVAEAPNTRTELLGDAGPSKFCQQRDSTSHDRFTTIGNITIARDTEPVETLQVLKHIQFSFLHRLPPLAFDMLAWPLPAQSGFDP